MQFIASLFIANPLNILAVAVLFLLAYFARRFMLAGGETHSRWLMVAAAAWLVYAAWEWLILVRTPEANIRVDLLLIYPLLAVLSAWGIYRAYR